jgi:hypothetical protein
MRRQPRQCWDRIRARVAGHRGSRPAQMRHVAGRHRVLAVDLRGHGDSDAPAPRCTMRGCRQTDLGLCPAGRRAPGRRRPPSRRPDRARARGVGSRSPPSRRHARLRAAATGRPCDRSRPARRRAAEPGAGRTLRDSFAASCEPHDHPPRTASILTEAVKTPAPRDQLGVGGVTTKPNADLARTLAVNPRRVVGRMILFGRLCQLEVSGRSIPSPSGFSPSSSAPAAAGTARQVSDEHRFG